MSAAFLPRVFAGATEVFTLVRQADGATLALRPLSASGSNLGQLIRFCLAGLAFFVALWAIAVSGRHADHVRHGMIAATLLHIALSIVDLATPYLNASLLSPIRNAYVAVLDDQLLLGVRRLIAGFPEPSAFAIFTIALYGFWLRFWFTAPRPLLPGLLVLLLAALLIRSTSSAAYIGIALYTALFFLWQFRAVFWRRGAMLFYLAALFCLPALSGAVALIYAFVPSVSALFDVIILEKLSSASGTQRMSWNLQALQNFEDTFGFGAGIGSLRASGWPFAVLGSMGLFGLALYLWFCRDVLMRSPENLGIAQNTWETASALKSSCAALLLLSCTILPQPNLGLTFFLIAGSAVGLLTVVQRPKNRLSFSTTKRSMQMSL
ncbi:MAG: hypothetical protein AAF509_01545 [Pseudomonadota bacterium]